jgi:hydrogenase/urease accessory protein HupE
MAKYLLCVLLLGIYTPASAHDPGMTVATVIAEEHETSVELSVKGSDLELITGIDLLDSSGEVDPIRLVGASETIQSHLLVTTVIEADSSICPLEAVGLEKVGDAVLAFLKAPCGTADSGLSYRSSLLHETNPATIQHVLLLRGDDAIPVALTKERNSLEIQAPVSFSEIATRYLVVGFQHILIGYDHIAFLLALLLWARNVWTVIKVVTAFTLSHTITLSLAALNIIIIPSGLIEPLIAASVIAVALENFFDRHVERRWRIAFVLGFIHGFGFAGALRDIGLPQDALMIALAFFNIGVELGQAAIVALVVPLLLAIDRLSARAPTIPTRQPALVYTVSTLTAGLGVYWLIERTLLA